MRLRLFTVLAAGSLVLCVTRTARASPQPVIGLPPFWVLLPYIVIFGLISLIALIGVVGFAISLYRWLRPKGVERGFEIYPNEGMNVRSLAILS